MRAQFFNLYYPRGSIAETRKLRLLSGLLASWSRRTCIISLVLTISDSGCGDSDRVALAEIDVSKVGASVRIASSAPVSKSRGSPRLFGFLGSTKLADSGPFILESPHIPCWREGGSRGMASLLPWNRVTRKRQRAKASASNCAMSVRSSQACGPAALFPKRAQLLALCCR